jgi:CYTH domain-containing protein
MSEAPDSDPTSGLREGKYARIERERRFLVAQPPPASAAVRVVQITDRYLTGTRLRLRRMQHPDSGRCDFKFTQKLPTHRPGHVQALITNTYLDQAEYDLLSTLPAAVLTKTRLSVPPMGVDVFVGPLAGLVLAEVEFA